jgi:hypothetical protein
MPANTAIAAIKAYKPQMKVDVAAPVVLEQMPNVKWVDKIFGQYAPQTGGQESIGVSVTMPPTRAGVWRIVRAVEYTKAERPTVQNLIDALRQKYGQEDGSTTAPQVAQSYGVPMVDAYWIYDPRGGRVAKPQAAKLMQACMQSWALESYVNELRVPPNPNRFQNLGQDCGANVVVYASWNPNPIGMKPAGVAVRLQVTAVHTALAKMAFQASQGMLTRAEQEETNRQQKKAQGVKPTL